MRRGQTRRTFDLIELEDEGRPRHVGAARHLVGLEDVDRLAADNAPDGSTVGEILIIALVGAGRPPFSVPNRGPLNTLFIAGDGGS